MDNFFVSRRTRGKTVLLAGVASLWAFGLLSSPNANPIVVWSFLTLLGFGAWFWWGAYCRVSAEDIVIHFGPLRLAIPISGIEHITSTRGDPVYPGWLGESLLIKRKGYYRRMMVSPVDTEGFLRCVMDVDPGLVRDGDRRVVRRAG